MMQRQMYVCTLAGALMASAGLAQPFQTETDFEGITSSAFMVGTSPTIIDFSRGAVCASATRAVPRANPAAPPLPSKASV